MLIRGLLRLLYARYLIKGMLIMSSRREPGKGYTAAGRIRHHGYVVFREDPQRGSREAEREDDPGLDAGLHV